MALMIAALTTTLALSGAASGFENAPVPEVRQQPAPDWTQYVPVGASFVVPGSGQFLQGDVLKGLTHLGFAAVCLGLTQLGTGSQDQTLRVAGGVGLVGIGLWSPWDAFAKASKPQAEVAR
ncbi:hypothetical protein J7643_04580 [bacterium]|nr:hypothetical protein [bacterium]